ncbi:MAG: hemerythrin domain-containing protein [Magnetospirillum gryphiswaldense]|nr:hemerythrin domain-containing protein [Magnetospirillum gryphiswaldense]
MPPDIWSETYLIGHAEMDHLHRTLVDSFAALQQAAAAADTPRSEILGLLDDWLDHFARHARMEENLMERLTLPQSLSHRDAHVAEHVAFLHQAMDIRNGLARGEDTGNALDHLGAEMIAFDMIRRDFELIGLLLHEGIPF